MRHQLQRPGREKKLLPLWEWVVVQRHAHTCVSTHMCIHTCTHTLPTHVHHTHIHVLVKNNSFHRTLLMWFTCSSVSGEPDFVCYTFCFSLSSASHPAFQLISKIYSLPCPCLWRSCKRDVDVEWRCFGPEIWENFVFKAGYETGGFPKFSRAQIKWHWSGKRSPHWTGSQSSSLGLSQ